MRPRLLLPYLAALLLATQIASAQGPTAENPEARRAAYQMGSDALKAKNWPEAERIFKQLWTEHPSYDVALGLGQAEFLQKKYRDAAEHLAYGIRNFPPREKPEALSVPKQALEIAKNHVGAIRIGVDRGGADVFIDGARVGTSPLEAVVFTEPGAHVVEARIADHSPTQQSVDAKAGEEQSVDLKFVGPALFSGMNEHPAAPSVQSGLENPHRGEPDATADGSSRDYTPAIVTGSVGAAALITGVVLVLEASHKDTQRGQRLSQIPGSDKCGVGTPFSGDCRMIESLADDAKTFRALSFASFGVAVAGGAATYFLWPRRSETAQARRVLPFASATNAGAFGGILGSF